GHGIIRMARHDPDRSTHRPPLIAQFHHLLVSESKPGGGGRTDQSSVVPGELGEGFWEFLQPTIISKATVPDRRVRPKDQFQPLWDRSGQRSYYGLHVRAWYCPGRQSRIRYQAVVECRAPEAFEILPVVLALPVVTHNGIARARGLPQESHQQFVCRFAAVERGNQRLHDGYRAIVCPRITPRFQVVRLGNMPVTQGRSLVFIKP